MQCPKCKDATRVTETRPGDQVIRRRRACVGQACGFRFWTVELTIGRSFDFKLIMGPKGPTVVPATITAQKEAVQGE